MRAVADRAIGRLPGGRLFVVAAIGGILGVLPACSRVACVTVFNATGEALIVSVNRDYAWQDETVKLDAGAHRTFRAGDLRDVLAKGGCTYAYDLAVPAEAFQGTQGIVQIQVQPDLSIVLLPRGTRAPMPPGDAASGQGDGFPIRPLSRQCA